MKHSLIILIALLFASVSYAQENETDTNKTHTIIINKEKYQTLQSIKGDTLKNKNSEKEATVMPGGSKAVYSPEQDSAYFAALELRLPIASRLMMDLKLNALMWEEMRANTEDPWQIAKQNLDNIKEASLAPLPNDFVQRDIMITNALSIPGITPKHDTGLISIGAVKKLLGLVEDLSPNIYYELLRTEDIEIVVYSVNATVIATLYQGTQAAGKYRLKWNLKDDFGRAMPAGEYIAEVRIGKYKIVRKRIQIK